MKGFLWAGGVLIVLDVFLQTGSAAKLTSGTGIITGGLRKFMSPNSPGIPNISTVATNVHTLAPGPSTGVPVPPSSGPVVTPPQIFV